MVVSMVASGKASTWLTVLLQMWTGQRSLFDVNAAPKVRWRYMMSQIEVVQMLLAAACALKCILWNAESKLILNMRMWINGCWRYLE